MQENLVAINSENLKKLILDIYEYRDKMSKILEDAELLVQSSKLYYTSKDGDKFREKFKSFSSTFPMFLSNVRSYGQDLENVLQNYKRNDTKSIDIFKKQM